MHDTTIPRAYILTCIIEPPDGCTLSVKNCFDIAEYVTDNLNTYMQAFGHTAVLLDMYVASDNTYTKLTYRFYAFDKRFAFESVRERLYELRPRYLDNEAQEHMPATITMLAVKDAD